MTSAEIVQCVRITDVAEALGVKLDQTRHRGIATWREGSHFSVSFNDEKNVWHDFVSGEGGGVVDFVARVQGYERKAALEWLARYARVPVDGQPLSSEDRKRMARARAVAQRIRVEAAYFADAAILLAEWALEELSPTDPKRAVYTSLLAALRISSEAEYRTWLQRNPRLAAALVHAGRKRQRRLHKMLAHFVKKYAA